MLKREWGAESNGKLQHLFIPSSFVQKCSLAAWVCSERPVLGQNALMMMMMMMMMIKDWKKVMATVRYFWHDFIHRGTTFMYLQYNHPPYLSPFANCLEVVVVHHQPSIFVDVLYWQSYSMDKFISCVVPGSSQWFFYFGEEIVIAWTHIGWVRWMFQNLLLPTANAVGPWQQQWWDSLHCQEEWWGSVLSSGVRFLMSSCDYELFARVEEPLRGTRYSTRDEFINVIGRSIWNVNKDGRLDDIWRLPNIWQKWGGGDFIEGT